MTAPELNDWIEREFAGYGRAIRRKDETPFPDEPYMSMVDAKELTRRAVAAFAAAPSLSLSAAPEGWQLVPVEPTREMFEDWRDAYETAQQGSGTAWAWDDAYKAMLTAAPAAPLVAEPGE